MTEHTLADGSEFGRYRVAELLYEDAAGSVYRGEDPDTGRVLLRLLPATSDPAAVERRAAALRAAAQVAHPHLVRVLEIGETDGTLWVATEHVSGPLLEKLIDSYGRLDEAQALTVAEQIGSALDAVAAHGLEHGAVSTSTIILGASGAHAGRAYLSGLGVPAPGGAQPDTEALAAVIARCLGGFDEADAVPPAAREVLAAAGRFGHGGAGTLAQAVRTALEVGVAVLPPEPPVVPAPPPTGPPVAVPARGEVPAEPSPEPPVDLPMEPSATSSADPPPDWPTRPPAAPPPIETAAVPGAVASPEVAPAPTTAPPVEPPRPRAGGETVLSKRPPAVVAPSPPPAAEPSARSPGRSAVTVGVAAAVAAVVALLVVLLVR